MINCGASESTLTIRVNDKNYRSDVPQAHGGNVILSNYPELANLTVDDAQAIVAYLKSLPAVKNAVPGPFGPKDVPSTLVSVVIPGDVYEKLPKPQ